MKNMVVLMTNYNEEERILSYIDHINMISSDFFNIDFVVSDNSRNWRSLSGENVFIYKPNENLYYINGVDFALKQWLSEGHELPEWIAVTNSDLEYKSDFFELFYSMDVPNDVAVIAPDIELAGTGIHQNPLITNRISRLRAYSYVLFWKYHFLFSLVKRTYRIRNLYKTKHRILFDEKDDKGALLFHKVYAPHGSAMFFNRSFFEKGGQLEFEGKFYAEEIHIAEQALLCGLSVYYVPALKIIHHQGSLVATKSTAREEAYRSSLINWKKYFQK